MDLHAAVKFLHVALAIAWLGGGLALILLGQRAARARNLADLVAVVRHVVWMADRVFIPASILVLMAGLYLTWSAYSFAEAWVLFGLAGIVSTIAIGVVVLKPLAERVAAMDISAGIPAEAETVALALLRGAKADFTALFVVLWAMVARPGWDQPLQLAAMLAVIALGAALFLRRPVGR